MPLCRHHDLANSGLDKQSDALFSRNIELAGVWVRCYQARDD
jgi:hypothetical protein